MELTIQVNPVERTVRFREVHALAAGDSCVVTLDGIRGADVPSLRMALYRDAASESPVASCPSFSPVQGHPNLATGILHLDTTEMAAWFEAVRPESAQEGSSSSQVRSRPEDAAERAVRTDGWLVVSDSTRAWAACRVPVILRPGAGTSGVVDPTSLTALVEGLVSAAMSGALEGKADKVANATSGNLASLDASGNLADSGSKASDFATPSQVASQVAAIVASAPENLDTLKEIADVIGQVPASGTVMSRLSALESGKADLSSLAAVATSGSYGDLSGRPAIPAVDAKLATRGAAADAKAVGDALRSGFTEWDFSGLPGVWTVAGDMEFNSLFSRWQLPIVDYDGEIVSVVSEPSSLDAVEVQFRNSASYYTVTRHLVTPTKTSQLTNDGAPTGGGTPYATTAQIPDVTGKADKVSGATAGNLASLTETGNLADSGVKPSDFAAKADLPYALVTPGEWEFSGLPSGATNVQMSFDDVDGWMIFFNIAGGGRSFSTGQGTAEDLVVVFETFGEYGDITATRASLPGHLLDRAVNTVSVTGATTLTLPEKIDGKSRDFYVRLMVSAESAVTFAVTDSGGDAVSWDSMGSPSATLAAGTYLYRFTEVADGVFHAADVTSGGSIDPAVLDGKLNATSAAPAFDPTLTYIVGEYVTYGGILYRCKIAVTVAGAWTGDSNWVDVDMTSPDATLDIRSDGRLAVVAADSEILWIQGYDMASASDVVLSCEKVNLLKFSATTAEAFDSTAAYAVGDSVVYGGMVYKFTAAHSAGDWIGTDAAVDSVSLTMPYVPVGKVGDFVLDVDNSANASVKMVADLSGLFTSFDVIVPNGQNLFTDILTFNGGEMCELYFTMTAFGTAAKPVWKVVKQVVEKQEAGS